MSFEFRQSSAKPPAFHRSTIKPGLQLEIIAAYSRDHDRNIGAGTFTTTLGTTKILYHRVPDLHPVRQQRFLANALAWLTT